MSLRTIPLPGGIDVDISAVRPLVDHILFQKLRFKQQLGTGVFTFPSATHTRFEHALGTFSLTRERTNAWMRRGSITAQEARDLNIFSLLHDIGHGPYSHATEALCVRNHNEQGRELLGDLRQPIEDCGGDYVQIDQMFCRQHRLVNAVSHKPLGTDKLDYLTRDARHTNEAVSLTLGAILNYTHLINSQMAIDNRIVPEVLQAQQAYIYMYSRVYFRKSCWITQCFLQKIIGLLMGMDGRRASLTEAELWQMTDSELDGKLLRATNPLVKELFQRLLERRFPKVAVTICPEELRLQEQFRRKSIYVASVPQDWLSRLATHTSPQAVRRLEVAIAEELRVPDTSLLIAPALDVQRYVPADVPVYDHDELISTLRVMRPCHYRALEESAQYLSVVRVCALDECREQLARPVMAERVTRALARCVLT